MTLRREVFVLVGLVLAVDAVFVAVYFLAGVQHSTDTAKVAFTIVWTLLTLGVVLRGLTRIRSARLQRPPSRRAK
jgi:nitric oxide reductase large subunit